MHKKDNSLPERVQRIYDFLHNNQTGVLTSVDIYGEPHGAVIYHAVAKNLSISFLTKNGTRKFDNLVRHPRVMLVVYDAASQTVAQVMGIAEEIKDYLEINKTAAAIMMSSIGTSKRIPPISKLEAGDYTAFTINPLQIRMASYANPDSGSYDSLFDSIESFELDGAKL